MLNTIWNYFSKFLIKLNSCYWYVIYKNFKNKYKLPSSFRFNGKDILLYGEGQISIGENTYIGGYSTIQAVQNSKVSIGINCQISHNVRIYTQSLVAKHDFSVQPIPNYIKDVELGNYVWIGANVFINPGVKIGCNSVVGANSVVSGDIPPNEIWGGVPARFIRKK
jgi:maltose O-acetyltransferase